MADEKLTPPKENEVVAQEAKTVGDDNLPEPREVGIDANTDAVDAQVAQPREADAATVPVHEVAVTVDEVITDPSDPLAVQVPDAGRGSLDLPIHRLAQGSPEDVFASEADEPDEPDEDDV